MAGFVGESIVARDVVIRYFLSIESLCAGLLQIAAEISDCLLRDPNRRC
jgi:hypothetical protein